MSGVEVLTDSALWHAHDSDELVHIHCWLDTTKSLCGAINDECDQAATATCRVCIELEAEHPEFCPIGFVCSCGIDGPAGGGNE